MLLGQLMRGASLSTTVILNEAMAVFLFQSTDVHVITVVPSAKITVPMAGVHESEGAIFELSTAVGVYNSDA